MRLLVVSALAAPPEYTPEQRVERADICYEALDFECTEEELSHVLSDAAIPTALRITAQRISAETALANDRHPLADSRLAALLATDPSFRAPRAWPKRWVTRLEKARAAGPDHEPPELTVTLPLMAEPGESFEVIATTIDRSGVRGVRLFVAGLDRPIAMTTTDGSTWRGIVPAGLVRGAAVSLWVEATDQRGNGPARFGSADEPRLVQLEVLDSGDGDMTGKWWFWTAIGGTVLVAAATGITVWALTREDSTPGPADIPPAETGDLKVGVPAWFIP